MKSQSFAVIELPATASSCADRPTRDIDKRHIHPNSIELEAFPLRLAWAFASAVLLLMAVSLLLAVADYAGSTSTLDLQPKMISSPRGK